MNKSQMSKNQGTIVQLRPRARTAVGGNLGRADSDWRIDLVDERGLHLHNLATGHRTLLCHDQIHSYMGNPNRDTKTQKYGFLQLRVQITLLPNSLEVEPLPPGQWGSYEIEERLSYKKVEQLMAELISEMSVDLKREPLIRDFFLVSKRWAMNYDAPCFRYFFEDHERLLNKVQILENSSLVIDITPGGAKKYRITEGFAEYLLSRGT